jgi:serine/threonine-protein phosphatase 4 regulatory subunit 1
MPLLRELCKDEAWHVRHSSLFAMPAVFGCLSAQDRRASALELILPLAADTTPMVRRGVLESLGEVIYCFHADQGGPPDELLRLFLGRDEDRRWWEDWLRARGMRPAVPTRAPSPAELAAQAGGSVQELLRLAAAAEAAANPPNFFDEPARSLVRAFNLPALALTLGVARWGELRGTYLELAESTDAKVRRTLAASTGEIARIVGSGHAAQDVLGVWRASLLHAEADVRLKAIEALETLLAAIEAPQRVGLVQALDGAWASTGLRGWREREAVARTLCAFVGLLGQKADILGPLVRKALEDDVAAVREAAIAAVVPLFEALTGRADVRKRILDNIHKLAEHSSFRKRMT